MSKKEDNLFPLLKPFGLDFDQSQVFSYLTSVSEASVLDISRAIGIGRTKTYKILEKLLALGIIGVTGKSFAKRFFVLPVGQFEMLVRQKKSEIDMLENTLPLLAEQLSFMKAGKTKKDSFTIYKGIDGLKTVTWNSTNVVGIFRIFELAQDMTAFTDFGFSERIRMEFVRRGKLKELRQITNIKKFGPWTNISEFVKLCKFKYIDPKLLDMRTEIVIYNNIVAMYQYKKRDVFCVEFNNEDLADMMKNLFDFVWAGGKEMKIYDERGSARIK